MKNISSFIKLLSVLIFAGLFTCNEDNHSNSRRVKYTEPNRPKVHFTPEKNWMGVPSGFVYFEGEYHLFFEHNPDQPIWGNLHWGHAVSKDLVHWTNLPIAIFPDSLGNIFSGCVVADINNTSDLGSVDNPPLIAFYMQENQENIVNNQDEVRMLSIAYSIDKGYKWIKYKGNPIITWSRYFSDPKVFWYEQTKKWIMCVAVYDMINFYSSTDCIHWEYMSNFQKKNQANNTSWQYPELFPLTVKGSNETKWVLLVNESGADVEYTPTTRYFIGDFDGQSFKATQLDAKKFSYWLDYGKDIFANISCSNAPNNRRIIIGWMNCWQYAELEPIEVWRGSATFPRELTLVKDDFLYLLTVTPIAEISNLYGKRKSIKGFEVPTNSKIIFDKLSFNKTPSEIKIVFDISRQKWMGFPLSYGIKFQNSLGEYYTIKYENDYQDFFIDRTISTKNGFSKSFNLKFYLRYRAKGPTFEWRIILDSSSIEFFADNCKVSITNTIYPSEPLQFIELFAERSPIHVLDCSITELKSIWQEKTSKN